jgi:glycosyltransferase involved in cell wall biosynthesis
VNKGVALSRNLGIQKASYELIVFCDADDILEANCIEILFELTKIVPTSLVYFGDEQIVRTDGSIRLPSVQSRPRYMGVTKNPIGIDAYGGVVSVLGNDLFMALTDGSFVPMSGVLIRKSALLSAGLFEKLRWSEDLNLFLQLSKAGTFCTTSTRVVRKLEHQNNLTAATRSDADGERTREDDLKSALISLNSALAYSFIIEKSRASLLFINENENDKLMNQINGNVRSCLYFSSKCGLKEFFKHYNFCKAIKGSPNASLKDYLRAFINSVMR